MEKGPHDPRVPESERVPDLKAQHGDKIEMTQRGLPFHTKEVKGKVVL